MSSSHNSFHIAATRFLIVTLVGVVFFVLASAGTSAAGFPFADSVKAFFGLGAASALSGQMDVAVSITLVINEIDYDQVSTDHAEFIEIKNVSASSINLDLYDVVLVNGDSGGAVIYRTIDLPNINLAAGDYYVVCGGTVTNCDLDLTTNTDLIQNGSPDAIGLRLAG
ncbi:MAG TPA: lamin tail domain-containing protein, partial [Pyrinomonadaceae bacterium]|nr:lamin tail domain-containing protein [Pyrinomonadaceae bacterium]